MGIEEMVGWGALGLFVLFIGWRVAATRNKTPTSGSGGGSWKNDKYPGQDKN